MDKDLQWEVRASLPQILGASVQPVEACVVRLTVLEQTSTGGHRVKVEGVMVQEHFAGESLAYSGLATLQDQ